MMDTDADGQREVLAFTPNAEIFPRPNRFSAFMEACHRP